MKIGIQTDTASSTEVSQDSDLVQERGLQHGGFVHAVTAFAWREVPSQARTRVLLAISAPP